MCVQGIKATKERPNSYLYQALAFMATELKYVKEARDWYIEGTKMIGVSLIAAAVTVIMLKYTSSTRAGCVWHKLLCMLA